MLPTELRPKNLAIAQLAPQSPLRVRHSARRRRDSVVVRAGILIVATPR
jgi:hypothetical protein